jgi:hypothetical protein
VLPPAWHSYLSVRSPTLIALPIWSIPVLLNAAHSNNRKKFDTNETFPRRANCIYVFAMKLKRSLPPNKIGRRPKRNYEASQKKDRDAIEAAFKRLVGEDGFKPQGVFGTRKLT